MYHYYDNGFTIVELENFEKIYRRLGDLTREKDFHPITVALLSLDRLERKESSGSQNGEFLILSRRDTS